MEEESIKLTDVMQGVSMLLLDSKMAEQVLKSGQLEETKVDFAQSLQKETWCC